MFPRNCWTDPRLLGERSSEEWTRGNAPGSLNWGVLLYNRGSFVPDNGGLTMTGGM